MFRQILVYAKTNELSCIFCADISLNEEGTNDVLVKYLVLDFNYMYIQTTLVYDMLVCRILVTLS